MLVYGQPGCGKTWLVGSAAEDERFGKVLMLESFGNPVSLRNKDKKPDILTMEQIEDFNAPYEWLTNGQNPTAAFAQEMKLTPPYGTIIIDGTTEVQRFIMKKVTGNELVPPGNLTAAMTRQGFGKLLGTMLNWATHYLDLSKLGLHIILTGLEANKQDDTMLIRNTPLFWGQSGNEICGYAYLVMRLSVALRVDPEIKVLDDAVYDDSTFNVGQVVETKRTYAKDQYGIESKYVINPTMSKVADLIGLSSLSETTN
jgi:hypothetical protein